MSRHWKRRYRYGFAALLAAALACGGWYAVQYVRGTGETVATVYADGQVLYTFDLAYMTETQTFTIGEPGAQNTIQVSPDGIAVIAADCPDQVCVRQGVRSHGPTPIVCLPNRLSIRFSDGSAGAEVPDAVSGTGGN